MSSHVNFLKVRVDMKQWGTTLVKILLHIPKCRNFLISVGCFSKIAKNCLKTWHNLQKSFLI